MWTRKECSKEWAFTDLAPFKSGTIFFLLYSEKITHSFTHENKKKKKKVLVIFFWIPIFQRVFLPCFCIFNYASASLMFGFVLFNFLYRDNAKKKKNLGLLSVGICVLCRGFIGQRTQQRLTVDSFTLKKAPLCCSSMRGEIIVQYR